MATIYNEQRSGGHGNKASLRSRNDAKLAMPLSNLAMEDSNEGTRQHHDSRADDSSGCHGKETGTKPAGGISGAISQSIRSLREFRRNRDFANIILLVVLYWLQGIPLGLANGSVPFLLKEKLSYAEIGMFTLASYPYSIKLVWSPIVDSIYTTKLGRRKSWIVPIQLLVAAMFLWFGGSVDSMMQNPAENISSITAFFLLVVVLSATQDIAVDGWALTLLSEENLSYASTCQTVGLNCGFFLSFTAFLALNSTEFSNKYIWSAPKDHGFLRFGPYLKLWAIVYILVTLYLFLYKRERSTAEDDDLGIVETYKTIWKICKLPRKSQNLVPGCHLRPLDVLMQLAGWHKLTILPYTMPDQ
ncbi:hypothetical protein EV182_000979 [Spiromyces aspiralis]|uniref:Uncharacterized protein n=1 Tax=Spiromyces aspiralis TaxID=68401 RepID=A0ACC1HTP4_9FUNG|nr:hypothetical protein EV182_000979 [Spiromyces aspiralis]